MVTNHFVMEISLSLKTLLYELLIGAVGTTYLSNVFIDYFKFFSDFS